MLSFDAGLTVWTLITFGCLVLALARFAFKPLSRLLGERESAIRRSIEDAARARDEARELLARNEEQLRAAREETQRIIGEGHRIVADMKKEARQQAKQEAGQIVAQARGEIDRELQRGMDDLKSTVANLSVRIARQVIRTRLDEDVHAQLADDFIERLKKSHASRKR